MMVSVRVIAMALVLASTPAWSSHPSESARDQYEPREDRTPQLLNEATDHSSDVHKSHRFDHIKKTQTVDKELTIPDMQVGCGDGYIELKSPEKESESKSTKKLRRRRHERSESIKRKRSYTPWVTRQEIEYPYKSITVWQPPTYQISRPYYIPVFGVPGRIPIYFPPQQLIINPGMPHDNPVKKPFRGPSYLPPTVSTSTPSTTTMEIANRFNGGDNEDDRPVWDVGGNSQNEVSATTEVVPTRRPPGGSRTHPPLVHNPLNNEATSTTPASQTEAQKSNEFVPAPQERPANRPQNRPPPPAGPSSCVWAIISCCSAAGDISYSCFEQRGCPGAFWDNNPCNNDFARAAIASALNYYNTK